MSTSGNVHCCSIDEKVPSASKDEWVGGLHYEQHIQKSLYIVN